mmetsp:Transcript_5621/g.13095  ORF Transcript_5621/g.13095 Transcript_5621/m.13095 type:complete len:108 (+) Transcript_5621:73-396(+)
MDPVPKNHHIRWDEQNLDENEEWKKEAAQDPNRRWIEEPKTPYEYLPADGREGRYLNRLNKKGSPCLNATTLFRQEAKIKMVRHRAMSVFLTHLQSLRDLQNLQLWK